MSLAKSSTHDPRRLTHGPHASTPKSLTALSINTKDIQKLFKNKQYVLMLIIFFWLFMINNLSGLTVIDRLLELKATSSDISQFWSLQAISEMVLMVGGGFFIAKFGGKKKILVFVSLYHCAALCALWPR